MKTTYTVADLRGELATVLNTVTNFGVPVTIKKYNLPVAKIVPVAGAKAKKKDWAAIAAKYAGMWSGPGYEWTAMVGKPSRRLRKRDFWS